MYTIVIECPLSRLFQILENITENIEEIEEEFLVFRDLSGHPNIPEFFGLFLKRGLSSDDDQIWFVMEVISIRFGIENAYFIIILIMNLTWTFAAMYWWFSDRPVRGFAGPRRRAN